MTSTSNITICLSWSKDDLFRAVCDQTAYNARTLTDDKGESLFDRYAMTEDERPFFDDRLFAALSDLLRQFRRIVPDQTPSEPDNDICSITIMARVSRDGKKLYSDNDLSETGKNG